MRHRAAVLFSGVLAALAMVLVLPSPARAAVDGIDVRITGPDEFKAGADARTVRVVASSDRDDRRCFKVRWSMVIRPENVAVGQLQVQRIEQGTFPVRAQAEGRGVRVTDEQLDPGRLCPGRTVTATYRIAVGRDAPEGELRFQAQAFDATGRLLNETSESSDVVGRAAPRVSRSPSPSASPSPSPSASVTDDPVDETTSAAAIVPAGDLPADSAAVANEVPSLLGPGLIVGALLVLAGVGLLLRIRMRGRAVAAQAEELPTGFYTAPRRRRAR